MLCSWALKLVPHKVLYSLNKVRLSNNEFIFKLHFYNSLMMLVICHLTITYKINSGSTVISIALKYLHGRSISYNLFHLL